MSHHPQARWEIRVVNSRSAGQLVKAEIRLSGEVFAQVFPTHYQGAGIQIVSDQLDFSKGMIGMTEEGVLPYVAVGARNFTETPVGPMTWVSFQRRS